MKIIKHLNIVKRRANAQNCMRCDHFIKILYSIEKIQ